MKQRMKEQYIQNLVLFRLSNNAQFLMNKFTNPVNHKQGNFILRRRGIIYVLL